MRYRALLPRRAAPSAARVARGESKDAERAVSDVG